MNADGSRGRWLDGSAFSFTISPGSGAIVRRTVLGSQTGVLVSPCGRWCPELSPRLDRDCVAGVSEAMPQKWPRAILPSAFEK